MPAQTEPQNRCALGTIVSTWIFSYGTDRMWSLFAATLSRYPSLHVPRIPSVSHPCRCDSVYSLLRTATSTWSELGESGERLAVVTMPSAAAP